MFQDRSEALVRWAGNALDGIQTRLGPPVTGRPGRGVSFQLLTVTPQPVPDAERHRRLCASLRYIATAWAPDDAVAHNLLGRLVFAAMQQKEFELEREPPSMVLWRSLGVPPQPGVLVTCRASTPLPARRTIFATTPPSSLDGRVMGVDGRPVGEATVAVPRYDMYARTNEDGHFHLPALPSRERTTLVVQSHGDQQMVDFVRSGGRAPGLVIQLDR